MPIDTNYDKDFYKWSNRQAKLLRSGRLNDADIEHIAEEIESMGKSEKRELVSRLTALLLHILKWDYYPTKQSKSWEFTIKEQRLRIEYHMEDNPSLKSKLDEVMEKAYRVAKVQAGRETELGENIFPEVSPYTFDEVMERTFTLSV